jgi:hypothetical protein
MIFIKASSSRRPKVVDINVQEIIDRDQVYAGCYVRASVNCYCYDQLGNRGVAFGLLNLQKVRDGEAFGVTSKPEDDFSDSAQVASKYGDDFFSPPAAPVQNDPFGI